MKSSPRQSYSGLVERELERERQERSRIDEAKAGLSVQDDFRTKDARENPGAANLKRSAGH